MLDGAVMIFSAADDAPLALDLIPDWRAGVGDAAARLELEVAAATLALALACHRAGERPDAAYRAFARAVAERDADRAYALLSSDTQAWLEARAKSAAASAPGVVPPSGRSLLLGDASLAPRSLAE